MIHIKYRILDKKLISRGSKKKHDTMIRKYANKKFISKFLSINVFQIFTETKLHEIFDLEVTKKTSLTPDIVIITYDNVYIGELKSKTEVVGNTKVFNRTVGKAIAQTQFYMHVLKKHHIKAKGFIIVGEFKNKLWKTD